MIAMMLVRSCVSWFPSPLSALAPPASRALRTSSISLAPSYYETIDGVKYDRSSLDAAREAVAGEGDGRVSIEDAKAILATITDGGGVTATEYRTAFHVTTATIEIPREPMRC
jgi:hypothetical protein